MKAILSLLIISAFFIGGCGEAALPSLPPVNANQEQEEAVNKTSDASDNTNVATAPSDFPAEAAAFKTYENAEFKFKMQYPSDWEVAEEFKEKTETTDVSIIFKKPDSDISLKVVPIGTQGFSVPEENPVAASTTIGGKKATQSEYPSGLIVLTFSDLPGNWNENNRLEFSDKDPNNFYTMLTSLQFFE